MIYDFSALKKGLKEVEEWFVKELLAVRTGRAVPAILDSITVESYGSRQQISHIASVSIGDARSLLIVPWDKSQIKAIETAILASNLGLGVTSDGSGVRVSFPAMTEETRKNLAKVLREKLEDAKVRVRKEREAVWDDIQEKEKSGGVSEDDKFRFKEEMQKLIDESNDTLDEISGKKEKEILE